MSQLVKALASEILNYVLLIPRVNVNVDERAGFTKLSSDFHMHHPPTYHNSKQLMQKEII